MTNFSSIKFDSKDVVKLVGFLSVSLGMWYDLKTDFRIEKETSIQKISFLQYQIDELKKPQAYYVKPDEPKLTTCPK
jgi:hypothetical protein